MKEPDAYLVLMVTPSTDRTTNRWSSVPAQLKRQLQKPNMLLLPRRLVPVVVCTPYNKLGAALAKFEAFVQKVMPTPHGPMQLQVWSRGHHVCGDDLHAQPCLHTYNLLSQTPTPHKHENRTSTTSWSPCAWRDRGNSSSRCPTTTKRVRV